MCVPSPRASISQDNKSRTYLRRSSVHAPVSAIVARLPANCSNLSLEGFRITWLDPLVMAIREILRTSSASGPAAGCLMVRIARSDVAGSNSFSSDQVNTASGSGACALLCGSAWHARGGQINLHRLSILDFHGHSYTVAGKGGGHRLECSPRRARARPGAADRTAQPQSASPPSGRPSPAPCPASIEVLPSPGSSFAFGIHAKQCLPCGNTANLRHLSHILCCMPTHGIPCISDHFVGV